MNACDKCGCRRDESPVRCEEYGNPVLEPAKGHAKGPEGLRSNSFASIARRLGAVILATQTFCAFGEGRSAETALGYSILLAMVFTPVALIWLNSIRHKGSAILEAGAWGLLVAMAIFATGNM